MQSYVVHVLVQGERDIISYIYFINNDLYSSLRIFVSLINILHITIMPRYAIEI